MIEYITLCYVHCKTLTTVLITVILLLLNIQPLWRLIYVLVIYIQT